MSNRNRLPRPVRTTRKLKRTVVNIPRDVEREIVKASKLFKVSPEKVVGLLIHFGLLVSEQEEKERMEIRDIRDIRNIMKALGTPIPED